MANLFEKAAKKTTNKVVKNEKLVLKPHLKGKEVEKFQKDFRRLVQIQKQVAELNAEATGLDEEIRYRGKECFIESYKETGKNTDSFVMESGDCSVMVIPTDKYKKIDEERAGALQEKYGEEIVTVKTEYKFNNDLLEKYQDEISKLLESSKKIPKEDKEKLIEAVIAYTVAKGAIDKAPSDKVEEYLEDIQPIMMMKNYKA